MKRQGKRNVGRGNTVRTVGEGVRRMSRGMTAIVAGRRAACVGARGAIGWRLSRASLQAIALAVLVCAVALSLAGPAAVAQQPDTASPAAGAAVPRLEPPPPDARFTRVPPAGGAAAVPVPVKLEALLTADGQRIDKGLIWRVFQDQDGKDGHAKLVGTWREASPQVTLPPGEYAINAAYGRAHLTKRISVKPGAAALAERFVLNAGGLLLKAVVGGAPAPSTAVSYNILSEDRDQFGNRTVVMQGARPGLIIRLNAGIYQIVSTYGDANATVRADVTVEAGKLTEATVAHTAARVTLKLVQREGGEAIAGVQWSVQTAQGELVKESVGALPTHTLAPGSYVAIAKTGDRTFRRDFVLQNADVVQVEVLRE